MSWSRAAAGWGACSGRPTVSTTTSGCALADARHRHDARRLPQAERPRPLRARRRRRGRPREPRRRVAGSSTVGHSFGGAVAIQAGIVLGAHCRGVVTLATQSAGCEHADRARRHAAAAPARHRRRDPPAGDERRRADDRRARRGRAAPRRRAPAHASRGRGARTAVGRGSRSGSTGERPALRAGELGDDRARTRRRCRRRRTTYERPHSSRRRCSCSMISSSVPTRAEPDFERLLRRDAERRRERLGHASCGPSVIARDEEAHLDLDVVDASAGRVADPLDLAIRLLAQASPWRRRARSHPRAGSG